MLAFFYFFWLNLVKIKIMVSILVSLLSSFVSTRAVFEPSIECSSLTYLILFRTRVELEFINERDILFKFGSFIFISNTIRARSYHELLN
jgi:hypothetical protein